MISYVLPTRDRHDQLEQTLAALGSLDRHRAEVIIVDNASATPVKTAKTLDNDIPVRVLGRDFNASAAARNAGVEASDAASEWIVMLDDDSAPEDTRFLEVLATQPDDVLAVSAEISLPRQHRREDGGLPEVFVGCGAAIRRHAFLEAGGYDDAFDYYAEEYDLAARLLLMGGRVTLDRRFRVRHQKVASGRSMNRIMRRLVRNNGWVAQRYAPTEVREREHREVVERYARIAWKERAIAGYARGYLELMLSRGRQTRRPLPAALYDRFTGLAVARESLREAAGEEKIRNAAIVAPGKHARFVRQALNELGVRFAADEASADTLVIGTLSPGPLLDAWELLTRQDKRRVIAPWSALVRTNATRQAQVA